MMKPPAGNRLRLSSGPAEAEVDVEQGGRVAALSIRNRPLLCSFESGSLQWGTYPMVPWAGRVADGRFDFAGRTHHLPLNLPPHAAHGSACTSAWEVADERTIRLDLAPPWPFGGRVEQTFDLTDDHLTMTLSVEADQAMPVMVGWHPWFHRFLGGPDGRPVEAVLAFEAESMYELDARMIPTGRLISPPPGPWDNCFTGVRAGPSVTWPGLVRLRLSSSCDHWVVFTRPGHALCVEPQSGAPDEFNRRAPVLAAGERLEAWFRLDWEEPSGDPARTGPGPVQTPEGPGPRTRRGAIGPTGSRLTSPGAAAPGGP